MKRLELAALLAAAFTLAACSGKGDTGPAAPASGDLPGNAQASEAATSLPAPNPLRNAYFGDLHVHSSLSFDAYLFGSRVSLEDSYRFARGAPLETAGGATVQLSRPLDFVAITDHAEVMGVQASCAATGDNVGLAAFCKRFESPDMGFFAELRATGVSRPPVNIFAEAVGDYELAAMYSQTIWSRIAATAEAENEPGEFTAFTAYEYSPSLPETGKLHRNVIFRNDTVPNHALTAYDAASEVELWEQLEATCETPCDYLTIVHNPNKSWGLAFSGVTIDGDVYTEEDWKLRRKSEPLVEMFQIKGNSECSPGFGANDEQCGFEQFLPPCAEGQVTQCIHPTSMARDGLKKGLTLKDELGFNPLNFGMIAATDTHNANPGDAEEYDFKGSSGRFTGSPEVRLEDGPSRRGLQRNPGGLAVIWAPENTRGALFDAMQRKEVYATSGTRIRLRFFASFDFDDTLLDGSEPIEAAYEVGVPMGGAITAGETGAPSFLVWATRDTLSAPLDRIQIVKGWREGDETLEQVFDVVCSDGREPDAETRRCPETAATVDLSNCEYDQDVGAADLRTVWTDEDFNAGQNAFYYARVLENPTCRWSTWDSLKIGRAPPAFPEPVINEMAWSSPIWINRQGDG